MLTPALLPTTLPGQLTLGMHNPLCLSEPSGYAPAPLGGTWITAGETQAKERAQLSPSSTKAPQSTPLWTHR